MKKWICFTLFLCIIALCGCQFSGDEADEGIRFCYPRTQLLYGSDDGVISSEIREDVTASMDYQHILDIYLSGPVSEELSSPFPSGTVITKLEFEENTLSITLNHRFFTLRGMSLTIASASIARTAMEVTDADKIILLSEDGTHSLEFTDQNLYFADDFNSINMPIGTEPVTP